MHKLLGTVFALVILTYIEALIFYFFYAENGFFNGSTILQTFVSKCRHSPYLL